jgi:hypothetical protein
MAYPQASTARWLAAILHQLSVSVEQWRVLAESRAAEADQYKLVNGNLKAQLDETTAYQQALHEMIETQKEVIAGLEQELPRASQHPAVPPSGGEGLDEKWPAKRSRTDVSVRNPRPPMTVG